MAGISTSLGCGIMLNETSDLKDVVSLMIPAADVIDQIALEKLSRLLADDLDFHDQDSRYASHSFHAFPAKFPPQLPAKFIQSLTKPGETVLDPMMGSGTTVLEAFLLGRKAIGFDIDPLALLLTKTKITPIHPHQVLVLGREIVHRAKISFHERRNEIEYELNTFWDEETKDFINYWFAKDVQIALKAILNEIEKVDNEDIKDFFKLSFSAIIITKSGGVSLALDLAHTRPHRVERALDWNGNIVCDFSREHGHTKKVRSKKIRSPFEEFERRYMQNVRAFREIGFFTDQINMFEYFDKPVSRLKPYVAIGNAQRIPVSSSSVDLIVTSPPYASNAIDYMRAHKFSLVWFGYTIAELTTHRRQYIGAEGTKDVLLHNLPPNTMDIIERLSLKDRKKGLVLHRYYSEMKNVLSEMFRVLKPGGIAVFVVGNSNIRGQDVSIPECLCEIGTSLGFLVPGIGIRRLDRNRRMMPTSTTVNNESQIQQRMHEEYVIGFYKPLRIQDL